MTADPAAPWLLAALCAPIALLSRAPVAAAVAAALVLVLSPDLASGFPELALIAPGLLAYGCGAYAGPRSGVAGAGILLAGLLVGVSEAVPVPFVLMTVAPLWIGRQVAGRRILLRALAERTRELEAQEEAFAALSVRRERARIARELHDIVAHHLAVIVVQAGAGRMAAPGHPERAAVRMASIRESGGHALAEMVCLVDVLHADEREPELRARIGRLIDQVAAGGLAVTVTQPAADVRLEPAVEDAAYRVVQEGLTNAVKMRPAPPSTWRSSRMTTCSRCACTTGSRRRSPRSPRRAEAWVSRACASGSGRSAGRSKPVPPVTAAGRSAHGCRSGYPRGMTAGYPRRGTTRRPCPR